MSLGLDERTASCRGGGRREELVLLSFLLVLVVVDTTLCANERTNEQNDRMVVRYILYHEAVTHPAAFLYVCFAGVCLFRPPLRIMSSDDAQVSNKQEAG